MVTRELDRLFHRHRSGAVVVSDPKNSLEGVIVAEQKNLLGSERVLKCNTGYSPSESTG